MFPTLSELLDSLVVWYFVTNLLFQVFHMLPREMCMMCSLLPGDDKLAVSVFWEITPEAEIVNHYFTRSVIKSCVQLAYEHAQVSLYC
jgi:DIS3-like exonuclease 2